jgi:DNA-binding NarL/FixJ family response regulator
LNTSGQSAQRLLRVALAESAPIVRRGVETVVNAAPSLLWAGSVDSAPGAVDLCTNDRVDVLLVGARFDPDWRLCDMLSTMFRTLSLVALVDARNSDRSDVARARYHGVDGLVAADTTLEHLVDAIRATADRGHYLDSRLWNSAADVPGRAVHQRHRPLSAREYEVLRLVADGRTAVFIGRSLGITADTVRTHVAHLLAKLRARDRAHAVARAYELSLLTCPHATAREPAEPAVPRLSVVTDERSAELPDISATRLPRSAR